MKTNSIADNCRSILRKYGCIERSNIFNKFSQQDNSCNSIPSNPIYSLYGMNNLQIPLVYCEEPSYLNTLSGLSSMKLPNNYIRQPTCIDRNIHSMRSKQINQTQYPSIPSENCIQMITNAIISKIRYKIPEQEIALLYCCLPSLIRQIMCKSPWLTPDDIIQWISTDILKESMNDLTQSNSNRRDKFSKIKQTSHFKNDSLQQTEQQETNSDDHDFLQPHKSTDDNESLLSYGSARRENSQDTPTTSQHLVLNVPGTNRENDRNVKKSQSRTKNSRSPSTRSFTSQQSKNQDFSHYDSLAYPSMSIENRSEKSSRNSPLPSDERSVISDNQIHTPDLDDDFSEESLRLTPEERSRTGQSRPTRLEYPGKIDSHAAEEVEKCLAFYQQMREYFDDNVAAMLFKCCLCYGGCSGKN